MFKNTEVYNFEGAFRGMRNPLESWDKSDSDFIEDIIILGERDLALAQKLIRAGTDHSKFMRQITVCTDITAPLYWWKEFDTYKVGTVANSTSTMHKLTQTKITPDCFAFDSVDKETVSLLCEICENQRLKYLETKEQADWRALIQILPGSWKQTRTVTMSYQNIRSIYHARKNHKLIEWASDFIKWAEKLPYFTELISI